MPARFAPHRCRRVIAAPDFLGKTVVASSGIDRKHSIARLPACRP
jgi:hypothetical protein